jgi:hypothetical protein
MAELPAELKASIENTKVSYKQLGKSGLKVSVPILGAMSFGSKDWAPWVVDDEEEVNKVNKSFAIFLDHELTNPSCLKAHTIVVSIPGTQPTFTPMVVPKK